MLRTDAEPRPTIDDVGWTISEFGRFLIWVKNGGLDVNDTKGQDGDHSEVEAENPGDQ